MAARKLLPAKRVVFAVDAAKRSGLAAWEVDGELLRTEDVNIEARRFSEQIAIDLVGQMLGPVGTVAWAAAVEKPYPKSRGKFKSPPIAAFKYWEAVLHKVARARHAAADTLTRGRYRSPTIASPTASDWRKPLGLRTKPAFEGDDLKKNAQDYLRQTRGIAITQNDQSDAACIAIWLERQVGREFVQVDRRRRVELHWVL